ncbi:uncharacterized protein EV422DRAFT_173099 [Fimicolochytrium jonesii]|uniref:uncharacterized protein n=1 Tax=Fimicolochytrium jonesii TaxID=1396493 RepID=UPI0022FF3F55|nr:uncharacterized protein EV422DRAFT_173099 [Fimicolochytrium jonesii]KAI8818590.1 hypothetical protein EV422DRAFT_173099 [Fimicolochytrium jonesii]
MNLNAAVTERGKALEQEGATLQRALEAEKYRCEQLRTEIASSTRTLEEEAARNTQEKETHASELKRMEMDIMQKDDEIQNLTSLQSSHASRIEELGNEVKRLKAELASETEASCSKYEEIKQQLENAKSEVAKAKAQLTADLDAKHAAQLATQLEEEAAKRAELDRQLAEHVKSEESINRAKSELKEQLSVECAKLLDLKNEQENTLKKQEVELKTLKASHEEERAFIEEEVKIVVDALDEEKTANAELRRALGTSKEKEAAWTEERRALDEKVQRLRESLEAQEARVAVFEKEKAAKTVEDNSAKERNAKSATVTQQQRREMEEYVDNVLDLIFTLPQVSVGGDMASEISGLVGKTMKTAFSLRGGERVCLWV